LSFYRGLAFKGFLSFREENYIRESIFFEKIGTP
jgi:hypothetical protein